MSNECDRTGLDRIGQNGQDRTGQRVCESTLLTVRFESPSAFSCQLRPGQIGRRPGRHGPR